MSASDVPGVLEDLPPPSIFDLIETDDNAIENGKWFSDVFKPEDGIKIKLRSLRSQASIKFRAALQAKYRKYEKKGVFPDNINERMLIEQLAGVIIVDWSGINDRDGQPIAYSKEAALDLATKLRVFRDNIVMLSMTIDNFQPDAADEAVGN